MGKITTWRNPIYIPMIERLVGKDNIKENVEYNLISGEVTAYTWESPFKEFDGDEIYNLASNTMYIFGNDLLEETERLLNLSESEIKSLVILLKLSK